MNRAGRPCSTPGCPNLMPCAQHKRIPWASSNRHAQLPAGWGALRRRILERDGYRCTRVTGGARCEAKATDVDHIIPGGSDDPSNLASLCAPHHRAKTLDEAARARRTRGDTSPRG